jgi:hypothetical protein
MAIAELRRLIGGEQLYAFALCTTHEDEYNYVLVSANTEEAWKRRVDEYVRRDPAVDLAKLRRSVRWLPADWGYDDFARDVATLPVPSEESVGGYEGIYESFVGALQALDNEGVFGSGAARGHVTLNILCCDMGERFFERGLQRLNPPAVVDAYFAQWTPRSLVDRINALSATERRWRWLALYQGLALRTDAAGDPMLAEARAVGLSEYDVKEQLTAVGAAVVPDLIMLLRRLSRAPTFNEPESTAHQRDGAFTCEARLATSVAFLIGDIGKISEDTIAALQAVVAEVEERDRGVPVASTLAENVARVLHRLRPRRFPNTEADPGSNHLRNAAQFVRR